MNTLFALHRALPLSALATALLLAGCGGGGDDAETDTSITSETAQSVSANSMVLTEDTASANAVVLSTTQVVVAGGLAGWRARPTPARAAARRSSL